MSEFMKTDNIREKFLKFFESKGHKIIKSDSLVPEDDPTLLFTGAGMNQFKNQFMGAPFTLDNGEIIQLKRAVTSQKCLRTGDLDNVGKTASHHTFFEMLGNFSFGNYFKKEAIQWSWEFLTEHLYINPKKIWVSVYQDDDEAYDIWKDMIGLPEEKVIRLGQKSNFWPSNVVTNGPNGPCGPCSEIFYDQGIQFSCGEECAGIDCNCDRFVEVWNLVFTQYNRKDDGKLEPLPTKNIDTGMGLERLASVLQGVHTNFEIDIFKPILKAIHQNCNFSQKNKEEQKISGYIIADHLRAIVFSIADGVIPSNESRGYVIRKLIRKAFLQPSLLQDKPYLYKIVPAICMAMERGYPELISRRENISQVVLNEEKKFITILSLRNEFEDYIKMLSSKAKKIEAETIFKWYDTKGLPLDIIKDVILKYKIGFDIKGLNELMQEHRDRSRYASKIETSIFSTDEKITHTISSRLADIGKKSVFVGYKNCEVMAKLLLLVKNNSVTDEAVKGDVVDVILDKTPFYGESGGQVGDKGVITNKKQTAILEIRDVIRSDNIIIHKAKVIKGNFKTGDQVNAIINKNIRRAIMKNHTATHLLQSALRKVLGEHIAQAGSMVDHKKLRFDFTHFKAIDNEQLQRIEQIVNENIFANYKVDKKVMSLNDAKKTNAIALFSEKYGDTVRVVSIADISKELCGGTHLDYTGEIGLFRIVVSSAVASGVRRLEAVTGQEAYKLVNQREQIVKDLMNNLKVSQDNILLQIDKIIAEKKKLEKQIEAFSAKDLVKETKQLIESAKNINGVKVIVRRIDGFDNRSLRNSGDVIKQNAGSFIFVLGSAKEGVGSLVIGMSKDVIAKGLHSGNIIREIAPIIGGGGGGRADMAQAGGKKPAALDEALNKALEIVEDKLII